MSSPERGFMIAEAVSAMNFEYHLKKLAERRERRKRGRKKKEADKAATLTTSKGLLVNKTYNYCSTDAGVCQVHPSQSLCDSSPQGEPLLKGELRRE